MWPTRCSTPPTASAAALPAFKSASLRFAHRWFVRRSLGALRGPHLFETSRFFLFLICLNRRDAFCLCQGQNFLQTLARSGRNSPDATFLIKRKWPKIDQGGPWTPLRRQAVQGGSGLARHWFHGRFQASALPLVMLWAVLRSVRLLKGPGSLARHWIRSGSRLPFGPHFLHPIQGETSAQPARCSRRNLGFRCPLGRV